MSMIPSEDRDAILSSEAQKVMNSFQVEIVDEVISRLRIYFPLKPDKQYIIGIDFSGYPYTAPIITFQDEIENAIGSPSLLETIKNWNQQHPPQIIAIIQEIKKKILNSDLNKPDRAEIVSIAANEDALLKELELSIKTFFKNELNLAFDTPIDYCNRYETFYSKVPMVSKRPKVQRDLLLAEFMKIPNRIKGLFIPGEGVFINKEYFLIYHKQQFQEYFFELGKTMVHEIMGHGFITQNTVFGKSEALLNTVLYEGYRLHDRFSNFRTSLLEKQKVLMWNAIKFTHEGWSEWVRWFFTYYYDDTALEKIIVPKNTRMQSEIPDRGYLKSFLTDIMGFMKGSRIIFRDMNEFIPYERLQALKQAQDNLIKMFSEDFSAIYTIMSFLLQPFSNFTLENYNNTIKYMQILCNLETKYHLLLPNLIYLIGFLIFKQLQEKYGALCVPELLKMISTVPDDINPIELDYYYKKFENTPDCRLALLLILPIPPTAVNNIDKIRGIVHEHLGFI